MKKIFDETSWLEASGAQWLESLYASYLEDPESVDPGWRQKFDNLDSMEPFSVPASHGASTRSVSSLELEQLAAKQHGVKQLITAYRRVGYRVALLDPLGRQSMPVMEDLTLEHYGLSEADLDKSFHPGSLVVRPGATLREIIEILKHTYCRTIGSEYMHIEDAGQRQWLKEQLEVLAPKFRFSAEGKKRILAKLMSAQQLELFLHRKYVGQKRFSLEGGETFIPLLDHLIQRAGALGVKEMVIGMAHRGRLNVLINTLGKRAGQLFDEFEGRFVDPGATSADVKYHKGFSSIIDTEGGDMHVALAPNPSHLEIVNPVVEGSVRARQDRRNDFDRNLCIPVLIHGDAAVAGQGVVPETINLSKTRGYKTGGTIHIVINNQIGFTTSDPRDTSSMLYCTDIFKMVQAPVFHVNGDDPEAVLMAMEIALAFRMKFHVDVVIDLVCFRLRGHNEADEPHATQPHMYQFIDKHPGTARIYADKLIGEGVVSEAEYGQSMIAPYLAALDRGESVALEARLDTRTNVWTKFLNHSEQGAETSVAGGRLQKVASVLTTVPTGHVLHAVVEKVRKSRQEMAAGKLPLDWGMAELLAYGTLVEEGYLVRISGQDCGRGTFAHRHAVWHNQEEPSRESGAYSPLATISPKPGRFTIIDSVLSEVSVLGYEYGYSTAEPNALVVWEAQFGDFANGAQVVIDQFIASGEAKWGRLSGLVMLLPHGLEGMGPEHSSARLERYLQLCAENNIQVCQPTTPAQIFHLLRRQMLSANRKPLVVMTPKSLLRHKLAVSALEELEHGAFQAVLGDEVLDAGVGNPEAVERVVLCSGKLYYDLVEERSKRNLASPRTALLRLEQLYPFPAQELAAQLARYPNARELVWAQDEHENQGAWTYIMKQYFRRLIPSHLELLYVGRADAAAPAVGLHNMHVAQQKAIIEEALVRN